VLNFELYLASFSLPPRCIAATAPLHRRGLGLRPITSFEYNLRRDIATNMPVRSGCDIMFL
jgi:hypothetical protein